jgi:hypothetical protein
MEDCCEGSNWELQPSVGAEFPSMIQNYLDDNYRTVGPL